LNLELFHQFSLYINNLYLWFAFVKSS
ncbi:hypothetical protein CP061683_0869B, partial [Chlamydia psittaci 06-1683]